MKNEVIQYIHSLSAGDLSPIDPSSVPEEDREAAEALEKLHRSMVEERRTRNEEMERCRARYSAILEETPVGICITNRDGLYEYVNNAYLKIYGYEREELMGHHFTKVVPPQNQEKLVDLHERFLGRQYELSGEWEVAGKDGKKIIILANAAYMVDNDGEPRKVTFVVDITKRKEAEDRLGRTVNDLQREIEEREKLEKARKQVERMVRHDLKNPLNGILGVTQLMMQEEWPEQRMEMLKMLHDSGLQMLSLVENFFDYIRMEDGSYRLQPEPLEAGSFLQRLCTEIRLAFRTDRVELVCRLNGEPIESLASTDYHFYGEPGHLKTVFENLVRNAFEASVEGDTVTVDAHFDSSFRLEIHNRAPVPEAIRERFFDQYVTYGKERGTGIGTYVSKLIVKAHEGSIDLSSSEKEGTTLYLEVPLEPVAEEKGTE